jgi:hypothetical protein
VSQVRRALKGVLFVVLATMVEACRPGDGATNSGCSQREFIDTGSCFVHDAPLRLVWPFPDVGQLCSHSCIETTSLVQVAGYSSLADVPVLGRIKKATQLLIDTNGLRNLEGLESLEEVGVLLLRSNPEVSPDALESFRGLSVKKILSLSVEGFSAMKSLAGLPAGVELSELGVADSEFETLALSETKLLGEGISFRSLPKLTSLDGLPSLSTVKVLALESNKSLVSLSALPERLRVTQNLTVTGNPKLSQCAVDQLASRTGPTVQVAKIGNGPCP